MQINNTVLIVICIFFLILYIVNLINTFESASKSLNKFEIGGGGAVGDEGFNLELL